MNDNKKNDIVNNSKNFEVKNSSTQGVSRQGKKNNISDEKLYEFFIDMKSKISNHEMFGSKIERLEETNKQTINEINEVKKSLYDPDEGIFARVKNIENKKLVEFKDVEIKLNSIQQNLNASLSDYQECHIEFKNSKEKYDKYIQEFELKISEINLWKTNVDSMLKWLIVTLASGVFGFIGKILIDLI